ncbi:MAG: hypothetical protein LBV08_01965, partial [Clostridiales bacterium]|nr:hypothetical protein [Clostridiales bacterium]
ALKFLLAVIFGVVIIISTYWFVSFGRMFDKEEFSASFDNQYEYAQLSSPEKTVCTIVIFENKEPGEISSSYALPYFNDRTIKEIAWGLNSNDLFIDSADAGLTVYRILDGVWTPCYPIVEDNTDGTLAYSLHIGGNKEQLTLRYELSSDTIPPGIKTRIIEMRQNHPGKELIIENRLTGVAFEHMLKDFKGRGLPTICDGI